MRRISAILATTAAFLAIAMPAAEATATGGGANNVVIVSTTADGSAAARAALQTATVGGDTLASSNIADADAHDCTGCRSVAVAVQGVFNTGDPSIFTPSNVAAATNTNCTSCGSFAYAYQYVKSTSGPVRLSRAGKAKIQDLREEIAATAASGLPFDELNAQLDLLTAEFKTDIDNELRRAGYDGGGTVRQDVSVGPAL
jgi:hypothetical protein